MRENYVAICIDKVMWVDNVETIGNRYSNLRSFNRVIIVWSL